MKKILMLVYSYHPQDPRPRREAEALIKAGHQVDMICLRGEGQAREEYILGGYVYRVNLKRARTSKIKYIQLYLNFCIRSFFVLNKLFFKNKYDVIHIHNMPDFLVFLTVLPKLFGSKVILDMHDPSPEMLMTIFNYDKKKLITKLLIWIEQASLWFSDLVITTNKAFVRKFTDRGCPSEKIHIIMNSPQTSIFSQVEKISNHETKSFTLMYHGLIVERHGLDILVKAIKIIKNNIPDLKLIVCGYGEYETKFLELVKEAGLEKILDFYGEVSIEKIAETIPKIDVGIIPNRLTPFTRINLPTRIFEYLCMKKPTIVPRTEGIKDYFNEDEIFYFKAGDEKDLSDIIMEIYRNPNTSIEKIGNGYEVYEKHTWEVQRKKIIKIYDFLTNG